MTLRLVEPEEMCSHIREAVFVAGADRIGHGVDVAFEEEGISLLDAMRKRPSRRICNSTVVSIRVCNPIKEEEPSKAL